MEQQEDTNRRLLESEVEFLVDAYHEGYKGEIERLHKEYGVDYNVVLTNGCRPIHYGFRNAPHLIDWLINEKKVTVTHLTSTGRTVLHFVSLRTPVSMIKECVTKGVGINVVDNVNRQTALAYFVDKYWVGKAQAVHLKAFIDNGALLVDQANSGRCNILHTILNRGDTIWMYDPADDVFTGMQTVLFAKYKHLQVVYSQSEPVRKQYQQPYMTTLLLFKRLKDTKQCIMRRPLVGYIMTMAVGQFSYPVSEMTTILNDKVAPYKENRYPNGATEKVTALWLIRHSHKYKKHGGLMRLVDPQAWKDDYYEWKKFGKESSQKNLIMSALQQK
jgi:hypothetical protein